MRSFYLLSDPNCGIIPACSRDGCEAQPVIFMENFLQQLVDQSSKSNELFERQTRIIQQQQQMLHAQSESLNLLHQHLEVITDLQLRIADLLDSELHKLWDQPILFKADVMKKLEIQDTAYRSYVKDLKLKPMSFGKIDWFFQRDVVKALLASKGKYRRSKS